MNEADVGIQWDYMPDVRVLVCGSRTWANFDRRRGGGWRPETLEHKRQMDALLSLLDGLHDRLASTGQRLQLVHGDCPSGADAIAQRWAEARTDVLEPERHPADWDRHGKAAGPIRNAAMVRTLNPARDFAIAAWDGTSRGTANAISCAHKAGIPVIEARVSTGDEGTGQ